MGISILTVGLILIGNYAILILPDLYLIGIRITGIVWAILAPIIDDINDIYQGRCASIDEKRRRCK